MPEVRGDRCRDSEQEPLASADRVSMEQRVCDEVDVRLARPLLWAAWAAVALRLLKSGHGLGGLGMLRMVDKSPQAIVGIGRCMRDVTTPVAGKLFLKEYQRFGRLVTGRAERLSVRAKLGQARRNGTSLGRVIGFRSQEKPVRRGGQSSFRSIVLYRTIGHLNHVWRRLGPGVRAYGLDCEVCLEDVYLRVAQFPARAPPKTPRRTSWTSSQEPAG